jgi:tripartite-type tricarboxylate transporter receptor subunit TctC
MKKTVLLTTVLALSALLFSPQIKALDYPTGPVSIIVAYGAGGGTDLIARALADTVKDSFPYGIAVENRLGGGGAVGMSYGQNSKPDGGVITMTVVELVTIPHTGTGGDIYYDKFEPIMLINSGYAAITVQKSAPWNTLGEFLEASKKEPMQIGNSGIGSIWHLASAALEQAAGTEFVPIPFDGAAPAITSLLGGHIQAVSVSYAEVASQVQAGELKVLALLGPNRLPGIPDVPTAKELGYDVQVGTWRGFGVPKGTPKDIVAFLEKTFIDGAKSEKFVKFMKDTQNEIEILDSKAFGEKMARDNEMFKKLITDLGLAQ